MKDRLKKFFEYSTLICSFVTMFAAITFYALGNIDEAIFYLLIVVIYYLGEIVRKLSVKRINIKFDNGNDAD